MYSNAHDDILNEALAEWKANEPTAEAFFELSVMLSPVLEIATPAGQIREKIVSAAWLDLLGTCGSSSMVGARGDRDILGGLLRNDRWQQCLFHEDLAYAFVALVANFAQYYASPGTVVAYKDINVRDDLQVMLPQWFGATYSARPHRPRDYAQALFGEVWCELVFDATAKNVELSDLILATRPAFLPVRLPRPFNCAVAQLPTLECSSL
jgi:hypothetical protein